MEISAYTNVILGGAGPFAWAAVFLFAWAFFGWTMFRRFRLMAVGRDAIRWDNIGERIKGVLIFVFGQKRMFKEPAAGFMHAFIFWGFCVLSIRTTTLWIFGWWAFEIPEAIEPAYFSYLLMKDFFAVLVFLAVCYAIFRRWVLKPQRITLSAEATAILFIIGWLMVSDALMDATGVNLNINGMAGDPAWASPVGHTLSAFTAGLGADAQKAIFAFTYWGHVVAILAFLNFLPYGKHFHVITAIPNVFLRKIDSSGNHSSLPLIDEEFEFIEENLEKIGAANALGHTWKDILDLYTCTECGRCTDMCPAANSGKPLSPKHATIALRDWIYHNQAKLLETSAAVKGGNAEAAMELTPIAPDILDDEILWSCTTCRACEEACPVFIEYVPRFIEDRRHLVMMESRFPKELTNVFRGMENQANPWGLAQSERAAWTEDLEVPTMAEKPDAEYLWWVGCAGAYDDRAKKVSKAVAKILNAAGVSYAILGEEESCTGDSARRLGNEALFQMMARQNIAVFDAYEVPKKKVLTNCPHCFNTLANEYGEFGCELEVEHMGTFISKLVKQGKLKLNKTLSGKKATVHDSCYLGRYNDVYEEPRDILKALGANLFEMDHNREKGLCCGAGGGRMWLEEDVGVRMNENRFEEARTKDPDLVATACPFCMTMMSDAIAQHDMTEKTKNLDLVELVAEALE